MELKTKQQIVFDAFCSTDIRRPRLMNPFINDDGFLGATDGIIMIFTEKENIDWPGFVNPEIYPNSVKSVLSEYYNRYVVLVVDLADFEKYKTEPEMVWMGMDIECKECDGHGEVEWEYNGYTKDFDCPVCKGSGYSSQRKKVATEAKTFSDYDHFVQMDNVLFPMKQFYKIIQAKEIFGGDLVLKFLEPMKGAILELGIYKFVIMPNINPPKEKPESNILKIF